MPEKQPIRINKLTPRTQGEHSMHGTIRMGPRTVHGAITQIPEGSSPQERLHELKRRGISAHLVELGDNEHRILLEDAVKVRIPRSNSISPKPDGQS